MYGEAQIVGPVQPLPPHCPYSLATPELEELVVVGAEEVVLEVVVAVVVLDLEELEEPEEPEELVVVGVDEAVDVELLVLCSTVME